MPWCDACSGSGEHADGCILAPPSGDVREFTFGRLDASEDLAQRIQEARTSTTARMREALSDLGSTTEVTRRASGAGSLLNVDILPARRTKR